MTLLTLKEQAELAELRRDVLTEWAIKRDRVDRLVELEGKDAAFPLSRREASDLDGLLAYGPLAPPSHQQALMDRLKVLLNKGYADLDDKGRFSCSPLGSRAVDELRKGGWL